MSVVCCVLLLVVGYCVLCVVCWLPLVVVALGFFARCSFIVGYCLFFIDARCRLLVVVYCLCFVAYCLEFSVCRCCRAFACFVVRCLLLVFVSCCWLLGVGCWVFGVCCLLFVVCW